MKQKKSKGKIDKGKVTKSKSKATRAKIEKLNANLKEYESVKSLMEKPQATEQQQKTRALDVLQLQKDLNKQKQKSDNDKKVENDILKQLDMINDIGI